MERGERTDEDEGEGERAYRFVVAEKGRSGASGEKRGDIGVETGGGIKRQGGGGGLKGELDRSRRERRE